MIDNQDSKILLALYNEFKQLKIEVTHTLAKHSKILTEHTNSLLTIENTIKIYGDMYEVNKDGIRELDTRLTKLEGISTK